MMGVLASVAQEMMSASRAAFQAGMVRLRPVLLTAGTTALSLLPTVLGYSLDAKNLTLVSGGSSVEMWGPMANAIIAGLVVSTVLTLVVVPALYNGLDKTGGFMRRLFRRESKADVVVHDEKPFAPTNEGFDGAMEPAE